MNSVSYKIVVKELEISRSGILGFWDCEKNSSGFQSLIMKSINVLQKIRERVYFKKLHNFIWLTFAMSRTPESYRLMIPYDSQFLVIEPENETTYKLTEIYTKMEKHLSKAF